MRAPPPTRVQTWVAICAVVLAAAAPLPLHPATRLTCVAAACAAIVALLVVRLRAHARAARRGSGVDARIARIRSERAERHRRGTPRGE